MRNASSAELSHILWTSMTSMTSVLTPSRRKKRNKTQQPQEGWESEVTFSVVSAGSTLLRIIVDGEDSEVSPTLLSVEEPRCARACIHTPALIISRARLLLAKTRQPQEVKVKCGRSPNTTTASSRRCHRVSIEATTVVYSPVSKGCYSVVVRASTVLAPNGPHFHKKKLA